jgi:hypothetical protein
VEAGPVSEWDSALDAGALLDASLVDARAPGRDSGSAPDARASEDAGRAASMPVFVAAGAATLIAGATSLSLATPAGGATGDFLIALVDAQEASGPTSLATPAGWTSVGGFPVHNKAAEYPPFIVPAGESHGTWIFYRFVGAAEPVATIFEFPAAVTARGVVVSYRGVSTSNPVHDKSGLGFRGNGDTNGLGSGNTSLEQGLQVNLIATALTASATYTVVFTGRANERFNTGEQPNGLNLIVHDSEFSWRVFSGPAISHRQSPSGLSASFLFSATTLVLTPR